MRLPRLGTNLPKMGMPHVRSKTLGLPSAKWRVLDQAHKKRNLVEYEGSADIDAKLLEALIRMAREIESGVRALGKLPG